MRRSLKVAAWVMGAGIVVILALFAALHLLLIYVFNQRINLKTDADSIRVRVLEVKSGPNLLSERLHITCTGDMTVGLWLVDLKRAGIFPTNDSAGKTYYFEGYPQRSGFSYDIKAKEGYSDCAMAFTIGTTSSNTSWNCQIDRSTHKTTFGESLPMSAFNTNWSGVYSRGSYLPLADLGEYKLMLLVK